jgi:hypothetical protein
MRRLTQANEKAIHTTASCVCVISIDRSADQSASAKNIYERNFLPWHFFRISNYKQKGANFKMESERRKKFIAGIILAGYAIVKARRKRKAYWTRNWLSRRSKFGVSMCLLRELREESTEDYKRFLRIEPELFDHFHALIRERIQRQDTRMRSSIPTEAKLALTLRYLATGML